MYKAIMGAGFILVIKIAMMVCAFVVFFSDSMTMAEKIVAMLFLIFLNQ